MDTGSFIKRLYGQGRAFKGTSDGEADRDLSRTSPIPYSPAERSFYRYPFDLGDSPEHQNFIVFDIYENDGEGLKSTRAEGPSFLTDLTKKSDLISKGAAALANVVPEATMVAGLATQVAQPVFGAGKETLGTISNISNIAKGVNLVTSGVGFGAISAINKAAQGAVLDAGRGEEGFVQESLGLGGQLKRAKKTIFLYMPGSVKTSYGAKYSEDTSFKALGMVSTGIGGAMKNMMNMATNASTDEATKAAGDALAVQIGMSTVKEVESKLEDTAKAMGVEGDLNLRKFLETTQRRVQNPYTLQLFESVERRSFDYRFEFFPKNREEVEEVYSIIRTFKRYSLPAKSLGGRFLDFPAEFRVSFINKDKENLYINRISRCALTKIEVEYGESPFTTFQADSGGAAPTKVTLALTMSEMEIMTQDRIDQGF